MRSLRQCSAKASDFAHVQECSMLRKRLNTLYISAGACVGLAAVALPASVGTAADIVAAPTLTYELDSMNVAATANPQVGTNPDTAMVDLGPAEPEIGAAGQSEAAFDQASHVCIAKVVLHEAGNQPRAGKVAVAQTLVNRLRDGRFGDTICDVANQRGQYFDLARYEPARDTDRWADAMDVARDVLSGDSESVAPGAMFFRANYAPANGFFRGRTRVASVGAHVFYR
jgi:N-acetylmuramoyl-L-alanine amidase